MKLLKIKIFRKKVKKEGKLENKLELLENVYNSTLVKL